VFEGAFGEPAEDTQEARVAIKIAIERLVELGGFEGGEEPIDLEDSDTEAGVAEGAGVFAGDHFRGEIELDAGEVEAGLFAEPLLETGGVPAGEVVFVEVGGWFTGSANDFGIREAVL
jgi:hypothetical protein